VQFLPFPVEVEVGHGLAGAGIPVAGIAEITFFAMEVGVYPIGPGIFDLLYDLVGGIPVTLCVQGQGVDQFCLVFVHEKYYTNDSFRCPYLFVFFCYLRAGPIPPQLDFKLRPPKPPLNAPQ
jgi:hypothetical protein